MDSLVELDVRTTGHLEVSLLWNRADNSLYVQVIDWDADEALTVPAPPDRALEVFRHPFAYGRVDAGIVGS